MEPDRCTRGPSLRSRMTVDCGRVATRPDAGVVVRPTNTVENERSGVYRRPIATVYELPPRRLGRSGAVPKFTEVSAPRNWNRLGASVLLHIAAVVFLVRVVVWL